MQSIAKKLDAESSSRTAALLPAIACDQEYDKENAWQLYGRRSFRFALIRWGNLDMQLPKALTATSLIQPEDAYFQALARAGMRMSAFSSPRTQPWKICCRT